MSNEAESRPLGRAVVNLSGAELHPDLVAIADAAGHFVFAGLPAGKFTLTASKTPYLPASYGETEPGKGPAVPISLDQGQQISDVILKLSRGGIISGRVLDPRGRPLGHAPIIVLENRIVNGERSLWSLGSHWPPTDSGGNYRAYGLPPGSYLVSAYPPGDYLWFPGAAAGAFTPGADGMTGRTTLREVTSAEITWALQTVRAVERGGTDSPSIQGTATGPPSGPIVAYAAAYYPGTPDVAAAVPVIVGPGQERTGIDFSMQRKTTALIQGYVIGPDGQRATNVRLSFGSAGGGTMSWTSADGTFSMPNLQSGDYQIAAQALGSAISTASTVTINGDNVTDVVLRLQPRTNIAGRIAFDSSVLHRPSDLTTLRVTFRSSQDGFLVAPAMVRADGTFAVALMPSVPYRITVAASDPVASASANTGWTIKSVTVNGREVSETAFDIGAERNTPAVIVTLIERGRDRDR